MSCAQCQGIVQEFHDGMARRELKKYRKKGPARTTRMLLDALRAIGVEGRTLLDVGGGVGVIQHELMPREAAHGTHVDASPAYLVTAREEAERLGYADRMRYLNGDIVELAPDLEVSDIVTLDRVICCYDDMPALVDATAGRARSIYGFVIPREHLLNRLGTSLINFVQRLRRRPFRVFVHAPDDVDRRVRDLGFEPRSRHHSFFWQVHVYSRRAGETAD